MANGKIHTAVTLGAVGGLGAGYSLGFLTTDPIIVTTVIFGTLAGTLIGPDLDVDGGNISDYHIRKIFKISWLWTLFWQPYRLALKHRSLWSHGPIISTLIRVLYIFLPPSVLMFKDQDSNWLALFFHIFIAQLLALPIVYLLLTYSDYFWYYGPYFIGGLVVSDILHLVFDR